MRCNNKDMSVLFLDMWKELAALQARVEELEQTVNVPRAGFGEADKKKAKVGHAGRDGGAKEKKKAQKEVTGLVVEFPCKRNGMCESMGVKISVQTT